MASGMALWAPGARDEVVGYYADSGGSAQGFIYDNGTVSVAPTTLRVVNVPLSLEETVRAAAVGIVPGDFATVVDGVEVGKGPMRGIQRGVGSVIIDKAAKAATVVVLPCDLATAVDGRGVAVGGTAITVQQCQRRNMIASQATTAKRSNATREARPTSRCPCGANVAATPPPRPPCRPTAARSDPAVRHRSDGAR
jgi:hypothetical protein